MANSNLTNAKKAKNDEFYTQYHDIEKEISAYLEYNPNVFKGKTILLPCDDPEWSNFSKFFAQNFEPFGLKKVISTSFASKSKSYDSNYQPTLFETEDERYDKNKTTINWKIFTLTRDITWDWRIDFKDLEWEYLQWDWDFDSDEIKALRDEADFIITNPPFSLFREFLAWVMDANKQFLLIGNINIITYKEVFPLIKSNKVWLWNWMWRWISGFIVPNTYELYWSEARIDDSGNRIVATNSCLWLTNIEHWKRHQPIALMTKSDNEKFNSRIQRNENSYKKYDNYDAIEIPLTSAIPSDYKGIMWVPITFLDKYSPEQFEIVWCSYSYWRPEWWDEEIDMSVTIENKNIYKRILIKHKK